MTYTPNFLPGIDSGVAVGETFYAFKKWSAKMYAKLGETPNMLANGFMTRVAGMTDADVNISTLYDEGNFGFTVNDTYELLLGYTEDVMLTINTLCESLSPSIDVTEPQAQEFAFKNNGEYIPTVL